MTVSEVIALVDSLQTNTISTAIKTRWLAELDAQILHDIYETHEDSDGNALVPSADTWIDYVKGIISGEDVDLDDDLLLFASFPYDTIYQHHLIVKINLAVQEINRANNALSAFHEEYSKYTAYMNRTYMPIQANDITLG